MSIALISVALGAGPAAADGGGTPEPVKPNPVEYPAPEPTTALTGLQAAEAEAAAQARATGSAVPVQSATTQTSTLTANPDGSFTQSQNAAPVRVNKDGQWTPLDATLRRGDDGSITTTATPTALAFSPGGTGPLAKMTTPEGRQLALSWPDPLPAPTVSGRAVLYPDVLPDIDLRVTAQDQGGFTQVLIVKTREAAENPKLATVRLPAWTTNGLTLSDDAHGGLSAKDSTGAAVFSAPTPTMWDSSTPSGPATSGLSVTRDKALTQEQAAASGEAGSSPDGPGAGAKQADLQARADEGAIILTPDQQLLTATDTHYPVYIDPNWEPSRTGSNTWGAVWEAYKNSAWDTGKWGNPGVGYQGYQTDTGIERVYYKFNTSPYAGKVIHSAALTMTETYSASIGCEKYGLNVYRTDSFSSGITWNTAPSAHERIGSASVTGTRNNDCPGDQLAEADVTSAVDNAGSSLSVGVFAADESNRDAFKRFSTNASLVVQYNTIPKVPTLPQTTPASVSPATPDCGQNTIGWIGATNAAGDGIHLRATVADADSDQQVRGQFGIWDDSDGSKSVIGMGDPGSSTAWVSSGTAVDKTVGTLTDGHLYGWYARSDDGISHSATTPVCHFRVDGTPPSEPTVVSDDYPASGSTVTTHHADDRFGGTFRLSASDGGSGVDYFEYSFNRTLPVGGATTVDAVNGTASLNLTPAHWGTNVLYVDAVDNAGNRSRTYEYDFYVPGNQNAKTVAGDLTGDGLPDVATVDEGGNIRMYPVGTDDPARGGTVARYQAPSKLPTAATWAGAILAHRGSQHGGQTVDDLFAYKEGELYLYLNPTNGDFTKAQLVTVTRPGCASDATKCQGYNADWQRVTQVITPGDVDGDGRNDLITVEKGMLWLFEGLGNGRFRDSVQIGAGGWQSMTVLAPGDIGAAGGAARDGLPDLWARDTTTGALYAYYNRPGDPMGLGDITTRQQIGSGFSLLAHPSITSDGDLDGDSYADLVSTTWDGRLIEFPGRASAAGQYPFTSAADISQRVWGKTIQTLEGSPYRPYARNDYDGDGRSDLTAISGSGNLFYWHSNGNGSLRNGSRLWAGDGDYLTFRDLAPGDFNGDGKTDVADISGLGTLYWKPGDGNGGLGGTQQLWPTDEAFKTFRDLTSGDFNGDGKSDVAVISGSGNLLWWAGDGNGNLGAAHPLWPNEGGFATFRDLTTGDFNADGKTDVAAISGAGNLYWWAGDGNGNLSTAQRLWPNEGDFATFRDLTTGDFNADGKTDVAAISGAGNLYWWAGDGNGNLSTAQRLWPNEGGFATFRDLA
ncbi:FG-GAP-like repeat-containing protein [Streptomyces sp. TLI_146]|uniref:FG-GAP-like repeat-containing protein n=1 Tax=Streptomyces sp. TLI_146 TaxID=1938858 RepID=UPI00117FBA41|nr:FG-GAP-like repeat-containing protein [Streptomyces sp. TLI_146]